MSTISVIMPIYNLEEYVEKAVRSVMNQTHRNLEIILVNDGSHDQSGFICDRLAQEDPRIIALHQENGGLSAARNAGIDRATGDFLAFVDGDDTIEPVMYERLLHLAEAHSADIAAGLMTGLPEALLPRTIEVLQSDAALHALYNRHATGFSACNKLFHRSLFRTIRFPVRRVYEDAAIMYRLYHEASTIVFTNEAFYHYEIRQDSITRTTFSEKRFDIVTNFEETYAFMNKNYPALCEQVAVVYFASLKMMVLDINGSDRSKASWQYLLRVSRHVRAIRRSLLTNSLLPSHQKAKALVMAWFPFLLVFITQKDAS